MKLTFATICVFFCFPFLLQSQITRQEDDKKDKNKKIVYKVEGSSDLDILNQLDPDIEIGQEIQIAWEKPQQQPISSEQTQMPTPKPIETPRLVEQPPKVLTPSTTSTPPSSIAERESSSPKIEKQKVIAMSSQKRRKKKAFKTFAKAPKKQRRKKLNSKKCYTF